MRFTHEYGFPREILEIVFIHLDPETFVRSRSVCKFWREILDYLSQRMYWKMVCQKQPDIYIPIHEKGLLNWRNVYRNSVLWKKIKDSKVTIKDVINSDRIEHVFVNNEEELCITLRNKLLVKDATTFEDIKSIEGYYSMFLKNKYMAAILTEYRQLYIQSLDGAMNSVKTLDNIQLFRISENKCVYLTTDKRIWECRLEGRQFTEPISLARWYGSDTIIDMHSYAGIVYFLTDSGKYLKYCNNRLNHINTFTWVIREYINYQRFHLFGENNLIYCNDSILYVQLKSGEKRTYTDMRQISSILLHGNVLFLGTHWGKVFIYGLNKLEDLLYLQLDKPLYSFPMKASQPIFGMDVFEEAWGHTLFIRTRNNLTSIHFSHEIYKH